MSTKKISSQQVRIGNLLLSGSTIVKVWSMENPLQFTVYDENNNSYGGNYFEPIKITKEILLKLGYEDYSNENDEYDFCFNDNFSKVAKTADSILFYPEELHGYCVEIKYVHELQNIYYATFKRELTLKANI